MYRKQVFTNNCGYRFKNKKYYNKPNNKNKNKNDNKNKYNHNKFRNKYNNINNYIYKENNIVRSITLPYKNSIIKPGPKSIIKKIQKKMKCACYKLKYNIKSFNKKTIKHYLCTCYYCLLKRYKETVCYQCHPRLKKESLKFICKNNDFIKNMCYFSYLSNNVNLENKYIIAISKRSHFEYNVLGIGFGFYPPLKGVKFSLCVFYLDHSEILTRKMFYSYDNYHKITLSGGYLTKINTILRNLVKTYKKRKIYKKWYDLLNTLAYYPCFDSNNKFIGKFARESKSSFTSLNN